MREKVYNLFIYTDGDVIEQLGVVVHELDGTDDEKATYIRDSVSQDYTVAERAVVKIVFIWHIQWCI